MIRKYNSKREKQQSKPELITCRQQNKMSTTALKANNTNRGGLAPSFEHNNNTKTAAVTMSKLAADLCKAAVGVQPNPASMEAVVVNSIIYSKPSFCSIVVDIGGMETTIKTPAATTTPTISCCKGIGLCNKDKIAEHVTHKSHTAPWTEKSFTASEGYFPGNVKATSAATPSAATDGQDAHVYMMCTTMNGSIHHQISELCDNLIAMGLFGMANSSEHDDDSLIEFAYDDDENDSNQTCEDQLPSDDDDEDETDNEVYDYGDGDEDEDDDDDDACLYDNEDIDVVDFVKSCPIVEKPTYKYCDNNKKKVQRVRFNTKPVVHVMHTWNYAYRAARKGNWEMYARDRERFRLRIHRVAMVLNPVLDREHRQKIYENRFANLYDDVIVKDKGEEKPKEKPQPKNPNQKKKQRKKKRKRRRLNF